MASPSRIVLCYFFLVPVTLVATELPPLYAFWYTPYHALLLKLLDSHGPAAYIPCAPGLAQESVRNLSVTGINIPLYS